jgi:2-methylcitrate dehydratase PrpD
MTQRTKTREDGGITLARFAAELTFDKIPAEVVAKVKELMLDSFGVAIAGSMTRAEVVDKFRRCFGFAKRPTDNRRIDAILHAVDSLETLKETRELGTLLAL